jgi:hypothetical protein
MVSTGIQDFISRYDFKMIQEGLLVTDNKTGDNTKAMMVKRIRYSKGDRWRITSPIGCYYFWHLAIRVSHLCRSMKGQTVKELHKRNYVEVTIFQLR